MNKSYNTIKVYQLLLNIQTHACNLQSLILQINLTQFILLPLQRYVFFVVYEMCLQSVPFIFVNKISYKNLNIFTL